ncbi:hypothetical protein TYRP_013549 [Tyrophagus putrescentiae]|nr:hypothetical protein TYRP_013549 [Tyrophagus putrescentiae]
MTQKLDDDQKVKDDAFAESGSRMSSGDGGSNSRNTHKDPCLRNCCLWANRVERTEKLFRWHSAPVDATFPTCGQGSH